MMTTIEMEDGLQPFAGEVLAGSGEAVKRLRMQVARIAPHFRVALLTGEGGVGKESVAREMHRLSAVGTGEFRGCTAADFAEGRADGTAFGTVYARGLDRLELGAQERLMRRLEGVERAVRRGEAETRMIFGSECDPRGMAAAGRLRKDLYARLGMVEIRVAPLRERREDLECLAGAMLGRLVSKATFGPEAMARMREYGWPGNLRELWEMAEGVAQVRGVIVEEDLPVMQERRWKAAEAPEPKVVRLEDVMRRHVMEVLERCAGNKLRAAELLGISRSTLYRMLEAGAA